MRLETQSAGPSDVKGTFTLLLYGGRYPDDLERAAFLDCEEDRYRFEPYAPAFDFQTFRSLEPTDALQHAEAFVSRHTAFSRSYLSKIIGPHNEVIGFEVVPIYHSFSVGIPNPLEIAYFLEADRVVIRVRLQPLADPFRSNY